MMKSPESYRLAVFDVQLGRSAASLSSYLKRLPSREKVQVIVMDLSETYRRIAREYFALDNDVPCQPRRVSSAS